MEERTVGNTGISIATHLALEPLFSDNKTQKLERYDSSVKITHIDINLYKYHYFNIYTLIRNIIGSYTTKPNLADINFINSIYDILSTEYNLIRMLYDGTDCIPYLYKVDYTKIYSGYNVGKETADTVIYREHLIVADVVSKMYKTKLMSGKASKNHILPPMDKPNLKGLITTNIAVDLFTTLDVDLLESHTGRLKTKNEFSTKLKRFGKRDLSTLPFIEEIVYIFGDNSIVTSLPPSVKNRVYNLAIEKNWTVKTTRDKVLFDLKRAGIEEIANFKPMYTGVSYGKESTAEENGVQPN